ncbi:PCI domain-containing protein [Aphelenchoides fujianensis]|nr:PCI domain-containing protein [Aphelenchoides fujianensis]
MAASELADEIKAVEEEIESARAQNRMFVRQKLQAKLIRLLNALQRYPQALQRATELVRELKKVDDKDLIVDVQLEESKACYFLSSLSKARSALTSARTTANSMYVSPSTQAALDLQSGILHAADERDFKTAFSYFYEAFEGYDLAGKQAEAARALKYMLLCKIMLNTPEEVAHITSQKHALKYRGPEQTAMERDRGGRQEPLAQGVQRGEAFEQHAKELKGDPVVQKHFAALSDAMLEKELSRQVEPYSFVHLAHVARQIGLSVEKVEKKLAQMILDQKFYGHLHQFEGILLVYSQDPEEHTMDLSLQSIRALDAVVDELYSAAVKIR